MVYFSSWSWFVLLALPDTANTDTWKGNETTNTTTSTNITTTTSSTPPPTSNRTTTTNTTLTASPPPDYPIIVLTPHQNGFVKVGASWTDPGYRCWDPEEGPILTIDVDPFPSTITFPTAGVTLTITYTCSDTIAPIRTVTQTRDITVRGPPVLTKSGPTTAHVRKGSFGHRIGCFCQRADTTQCTGADVMQLDSESGAGELRQAQCRLLCQQYDLVNGGVKGCELRGSTIGDKAQGCWAQFRNDIQNPVLSGTVCPGDTFCWKSEFADPGSCCVNYQGNSDNLVHTQTPTPLTTTAGTLSIAYYCTDVYTLEGASSTMSVVVDSKPTIALIPPSPATIVRGMGYVDAGAVCQDTEDGNIGLVPLNAVSKITPSSVSLSGSSASPVNYFAATDGTTNQTCGSCFITIAETSTTNHWIRFELGHLRIVHALRLNRPSALAGWVARVGTRPTITDNEMCFDNALASVGWYNVSCSAPMVGSLVTLSFTSEMVLCEIEIYGTAGPQPASTITIANCESTFDGTYNVRGAQDGWPSYELSTDSTRILWFNHAVDSWEFNLGGSTPQVRACAGCALQHATTWTDVSSGGIAAGCTTPTLQFHVDSCPWLYGWASSTTTYKCYDGSEVSSAVACDGQGGLARCPQYKKMCQVAATDSSNSMVCATDCTLAGGGGIRACLDTNNPGSLPGIIESNAYFLGSWDGTEGNKNADVGVSFTTIVGFVVTHLGRHERTSTPLSETVQVNLWEVSSTAKIASVDVTPTSTKEGNYRFEKLSSPVTLEASKEYRLSQQCTDGMFDLWYDGTVASTDLYTATNYQYASFGQGVESNSGYGYPITQVGLYRRAGMVSFKFAPFPTRMDKSGFVDGSVGGTYKVVYTCADTLGQVTAVSRSVEVGCEGPNPGGTYGGNQVGCTDYNVAQEVQSVASFTDCQTYCLALVDCEAAVFWTHNLTCQRKRSCTGQYTTTSEVGAQNRYVGYCKRIDAPPSVVLGPSTLHVNQNDVWVEGAYSCTDNEDNPPPTVVKLDTLSTATPGTFQVRYSCTDTTGQTDIKSRNVTVKAPCALTNISMGSGAHPTSPCTEGTAPIAFGGVCTTRCDSGKIPTMSSITCVAASASPTEHNSAWDQAFSCGDQPCDGPIVPCPNSCVALNPSGQQQSCTAGMQVVTGAYCIPNCATGYVAQPLTTGGTTNLLCTTGTLDPSNFYCKKPAAAPSAIGYGVAGVNDVPVNWVAGVANDCVFQDWYVQAQQTVAAYGASSITSANAAWHDVVGCEATVFTDRSTATCTAGGRLEGATYDFRVMERCNNSDLNSPWVVSTLAIKMKIVYPPVLLFYIPDADVTFNPQQLMLAWTVDVRLNDVNTWGNTSTIFVSMTKSGPYCTNGSFITSASSMVTDSTGLYSYVEISGKRIIVVKPVNGWFEEGCEIHAVVDAASSQTVDTPSKPAPSFKWNFTYIDVAPEFSSFGYGSTTTTQATISIKWNLRTTQSCNITPTDPACTALPCWETQSCTGACVAASVPTACTSLSCWATKSCTGACFATSVPTATQITDTSVIEYTVTGLWPGTTYIADCSGFKYGKPWIPTVPIPSKYPPHTQFSTDPDEDATVGSFTFNVTAMCQTASPAGPNVQTQSGSITSNQFNLGYTMQINEFKQNCLSPAGRELNDGETATMSFNANVTPTSSFAVLVWKPPGPQIDLTYTKVVGATAAPVSQTMLFKICPLAAIASPGSVSCVDFAIEISSVDIRFVFDQLTLSSNVPNATPGNLSYAARRMLLEATGAYDRCDEDADCEHHATQAALSLRDRDLGGQRTWMQRLAVPSLSMGQEGTSSVVQLERAMKTLVSDFSRAIAAGDLSKHSLAKLADARRLTTTTIEIPVGTGITVRINVSEATFDWSILSFHLGPIAGTNSFQQLAVLSGANKSTETIQVAMTGQGTNHPLVLNWYGVAFPSQYYVSFTYPVLTVAKQTATIHSPFNLQVSFTNVPKISALTAMGIAGGGYAAPDNFIQVGVYKDGQTTNLCNGLFFADPTDWTTARCTMSQGALSPLIVEVLTKDGITSAFSRVAASRITGQVAYATPSHTGLKDAGNWAKLGGSDDNSVHFGIVVQRPVAKVYVIGYQLPQVYELQLGGAALTDYAMRMIGDTEINMCKTITWMNSTTLECELEKCINVTGLKETPQLRMYLGDLASVAPISGLITLPRPDVDSFGPSVIPDVGTNTTIWFRGNHFGELSCKSTHTDGTQFLGSASGAHITVGDYKAPCNVILQNKSYIECVVQGQIRNPRLTTYTGTGLPTPYQSVQQTITFRVGNHLESRNEHPPTGVFVISLSISTTLASCSAGWRRIRIDAATCEPCVKGRYSTTTSANFPLSCEICPTGTYSDADGSTACTACPANTYAAQPADRREACMCKSGYYSQYLNETSGTTIPGTDCVTCTDTDLLGDTLKTENCGSDIFVDERCDSPKTDTCVPESIGSLNFKICKAYCPGGVAWPQAKATFYRLAKVSVASTTGTAMYKPSIARCDPPEACLVWNECHFRYTGYSCGECVFGYFRETTTKLCLPCGHEQVIGMVLMAGLAICASVGGLFGATVFMRLQADIVFKNEVIATAKKQGEILSRSKALLSLCRARDKRHVVEIDRREVGASFRFAKTGELGIIFRVDQRGQVFVAGMHQDSPIKFLISQHWKLVSVNGAMPRAKAESEVQAWLRSVAFPLRFVFHIPRSGIGSGDDFMDNWENDRKMFVMLIAVCNAFTQVSMFDFEWPPMFTFLADLAAKFSFNLNFFKPECSVEAPYNQKWMGFLTVPYLMMIPLTIAYIIMLIISLPGLEGMALTTKKWMIRNAYARTVNMCVILLMPFHLEMLMVPFACVERTTDTYFVSATPDTRCSAQDARYVEMLQVATFGFMVMMFFWSLLMFCLYKSFEWQYGFSRVRDTIPFYVAMVEVSVFGQRGYMKESRDRVNHNLSSVMSYDAQLSKFDMKVRLQKAAASLGPRSRWVQEAATRDGTSLEQQCHTNFEDKGEEEVDHAQIRMEILKGRKRWLKTKFTKRAEDGNIITYGWVLIVNLFWRQTLSLIAIQLSAGNLIVVGAAFIMMLHAGNITMLLIYKPYKSEKVSNVEVVMLSALFLMLWCAVLKDLLSNHVNVHLFQDTLNKVNIGIDCLAILLMLLVFGVPLQQAQEMGLRALLAMRSADAILNTIYYANVQKDENARKEKARNLEQLHIEETMADHGLYFPHALARKHVVIKKALERINTSVTVAPSYEQKRRYQKFIRLLKHLDKEGPDKRRKVLTSGDDVEECETTEQSTTAELSMAYTCTEIGGSTTTTEWKHNNTQDSNGQVDGQASWKLGRLGALAAGDAYDTMYKSGMAVIYSEEAMDEQRPNAHVVLPGARKGIDDVSEVSDRLRRMSHANSLTPKVPDNPLAPSTLGALVKAAKKLKDNAGIDAKPKEPAPSPSKLGAIVKAAQKLKADAAKSAEAKEPAPSHSQLGEVVKAAHKLKAGAARNAEAKEGVSNVARQRRPKARSADAAKSSPSISKAAKDSRQSVSVETKSSPIRKSRRSVAGRRLPNRASTADGASTVEERTIYKRDEVSNASPNGKLPKAGYSIVVSDGTVSKAGSRMNARGGRSASASRKPKLMAPTSTGSTQGVASSQSLQVPTRHGEETDIANDVAFMGADTDADMNQRRTGSGAGNRKRATSTQRQSSVRGRGLSRSRTRSTEAKSTDDSTVPMHKQSTDATRSRSASRKAIGRSGTRTIDDGGTSSKGLDTTPRNKSALRSRSRSLRSKATSGTQDESKAPEEQTPKRVATKRAPPRSRSAASSGRKPTKTAPGRATTDDPSPSNATATPFWDAAS